MEVLTLNHLWEKIGSVFATKAQLHAGLSSKQGTLVSGQSIKTINGKSILGQGNMDIANVPALNAAPTSSTTTYTKDGQTVDFEIGQFARVAKQGGYDFYQLYDLVTESNHTPHEGVPEEEELNIKH